MTILLLLGHIPRAHEAAHASTVTAPLSLCAFFSLSAEVSVRLASRFASDDVWGWDCFLWLAFGLAATKLALGVAGVDSSMRANVAEDTSLRLAASLLRGGMASEKAPSCGRSGGAGEVLSLLSRAMVELGNKNRCARQQVGRYGNISGHSFRAMCSIDGEQPRRGLRSKSKSTPKPRCAGLN